MVWAGGDNADPAQLGNNDFSLHYVKLKQPVSRQADARLFAIRVLPILGSASAFRTTQPPPRSCPRRRAMPTG